MRATIRDVSERAQVSVGTVSHALKAPHLVSALAVLVDAATPTAVVTVHDDLAIGAQAEARRLGIRIGTDLALTGFDDIPACVMVDPALTSVRQPFDVVGEILSDLVVAALAGEPPGEGILVEPELIVRASSTGNWG